MRFGTKRRLDWIPGEVKNVNPRSLHLRRSDANRGGTGVFGGIILMFGGLVIRFRRNNGIGSSRTMATDPRRFCKENRLSYV